MKSAITVAITLSLGLLTGCGSAPKGNFKKDFAFARADREPASASVVPAKLQSKLDARLREDIRSQVTRVKSGICGSDEPGFVIDVQVRRLTPTQGKNGIDFKSSWETVKSYGIVESEIDSTELMDENQCLE